MVKTYILRRYSIDELDDILYNKLNIQSRNLKYYNDKSLSFFMNSVVNSITNTILEELTDGWVEDSPVSEDDLYEFIKRIFENRIKDRYMELTDIGLRENIQRIKEVMLLEQSEVKRDLAPIMKQLLDDVLVGTSKMICRVEVINPKERKSVDDTVYEKYRVNLILLGGPDSKYWPTTGSIRTIEEKLMNKAQDLILDYMGQMVDVYNIKVSNCK